MSSKNLSIKRTSVPLIYSWNVLYRTTNGETQVSKSSINSMYQFIYEIEILS